MTGGHDHSCRVWKIPEETQLVCRSHAPAVDCIRYITATQVSNQYLHGRTGDCQNMHSACAPIFEQHVRSVSSMVCSG